MNVHSAIRVHRFQRIRSGAVIFLDSVMAADDHEACRLVFASPREVVGSVAVAVETMEREPEWSRLKSVRVLACEGDLPPSYVTALRDIDAILTAGRHGN